MKNICRVFCTLSYCCAMYALLSLVMSEGMILSQYQPGVTALDASKNMEIIPENDPRFQEIDQAYSETFGSANVAIDTEPKLAMGPVLRMDGNGKAIVTFKATAEECAQYAIAPTEQAIKDGIEIQFVSNDRLPENHKWKQGQEKEFFRFPFIKPVTLQYNDSGYSSSHGSKLAKDTNHSWGFRLYKNGKMLTAKSDYKKYVRHMISSNPTHADLASNVTSQEAELLIKWGLVDQEFKKAVLDPLRMLADQIAADTTTDNATAESLALIIGVLFGLEQYALLIVGVTVGSAFGIKTLIAFNKKAQAACDARKPSHQSSELRDMVILAR